MCLDILDSEIIILNWLYSPGALPKDHREEWLPGIAMGAVHHTKWRWEQTLTITHQ